MNIWIEGEKCEVTSVDDWGHSHVRIVTLDDGREYVVAASREDAGEDARAYWENLAQDDPGELTCIVGEKTLVAWALGQSAGPGSAAVNSLEEWLDLWLDVPEEQWAGYDGIECNVTASSRDLKDKLDFTPKVAYRYN